MVVSGELHGPAALPQEKEALLRIEKPAAWAPDLAWTLWWRENLCPVSKIKVRFVDHPARNQSLYLLRYSGSFCTIFTNQGSAEHR